jgi:hypothetical protein
MDASESNGERPGVAHCAPHFGAEIDNQSCWPLNPNSCSIRSVGERKYRKARRSQLVVALAVLLSSTMVTAHAADADPAPEYSDVDATFKIIGSDKMEVTFFFHDAKNRPQYTVVKVAPKQDSQADDTNPPFLLGKLSKGAITSSSQADHILVGVSGSGNASAVINISNVQASNDATGKHTFEIGFLRYSALKKTAPESVAVSLPGITYAQVSHVTIVKPSWSSKINIKYPDTNVSHDIGDTLSFDLKSEGVVAFDVLHEDSAVKRYSRVVLDNVIFFTGTVVFCAIFAFLAPPQAHKVARILLSIVATILGIVVVRQVWLSSPDVENYAPVLTAELGLIISILFFDRLDKLVQLFGR